MFKNFINKLLVKSDKKKFEIFARTRFSNLIDELDKKQNQFPNLDIDRLDFVDSGISNLNFYDSFSNCFYKVSLPIESTLVQQYPGIENYIQKLSINPKLVDDINSNLDIKLKLINKDNNFIIESKKIEGKKFDQSTKNKQELDLLIDAMFNFTFLPTDNILEFDLEDELEKIYKCLNQELTIDSKILYLYREQILPKYDKYLLNNNFKSSKLAVHLDLIESNIILNNANKKVNFIDFDYIYKANPILMLCSYLEEQACYYKKNFFNQSQLIQLDDNNTYIIQEFFKKFFNISKEGTKIYYDDNLYQDFISYDRFIISSLLSYYWIAWAKLYALYFDKYDFKFIKNIFDDIIKDKENSIIKI